MSDAYFKVHENGESIQMNSDIRFFHKWCEASAEPSREAPSIGPKYREEGTSVTLDATTCYCGIVYSDTSTAECYKQLQYVFRSRQGSLPKS